MMRSATFSSDGSLRWELIRQWDANLPPMLLDMLNPSKAGVEYDDPTVRKGIGFATRLGFGSLHVVNLSAHIATDPREWKRAGCPVDPTNASWVLNRALSVKNAGGKVVCAWGANARDLDVADEHVEMFRRHRIRTWALRILGDGTPAHPLMLPYTCQLVRFPQ